MSLSNTDVGNKRVRIELDSPSLEQINVTQTKGVTASLIDNLQIFVDLGGDAGRCARIAQDQYEQACMWAVKALTAKPNS